MKIVVGDYTNEKINNNDLRCTVSSVLRKTNESGGLGGVDHFMCRSIRTIVNRYIKRLTRDANYGFSGAVYNIVIELSDNLVGPVTDTVTIPIRCE